MESPQAAEPIAIIGMGMRLPGRVRSSEDFWELLMSKQDIRCEAPENRYSVDGFCNSRSKKETISTPLGYFLDESVKLDALDTSFFNLNQLQAQMMDPQQRLLLEVAWECIENAGQTNLRGSNTGVFAGSYSEDWSRLVYQDTQGSNAYRVLGTADFVLSSVLSYSFDLRGPSVTLRTACSAASTGLHMACQALYNGDCSAALVAGTSIIMSPSMGQDMTSQGVMSPSGLCKTFDASADGYARAEGINVVMVKLLKDAIRNQDPIRAVIRSTAVNSDGGSSNLSVPSPTAQKALIERAYEVAGITDLSQTAFVECHGTGTRVGDPIEAGAIGESFGERGVYIGSVKTNMGHTEGGSGITGLIKSVLALEHGIIPPNLNFTTPNPQIPFEKYKLQVPTDATPWPLDKDHRVSINCFGIGGSNSHIVLDSAASFMADMKAIADIDGDSSSNGDSPSNSYVVVSDDEAKEEANQLSAPLFLLPVSAVGEHALSTRIKDIGNYIQSSTNPLPAIAYTLGSRRSHLSHRAFCVVGESSDKTPEFSNTQKASKQSPRLGFVFTGQGAQHTGMGKELYNAIPSFRRDIDVMDHSLQTLHDPPKWLLSDFFNNHLDEVLLNEAEYSQPLSTALQIALVNVFAKWGIKPDLAMGHSSGELAAAYASGRLTMTEACKCSYVRGVVSQTQTRDGGMAVVGLKPEDVTPYLVPGVQIACVNSSKNVTISGDRHSVEEVQAAIATQEPETFLRALKVDRAYHSYHMEELSSLYEETLRRELEGLGTHLDQTVLPLYSTVTGRLHSPDATLDAEYWARSLASPVQFLDATQALLADNDPELILIEIGPHPGLKAPIRQIVEDCVSKGSRAKPSYLSTLSRGQNALRSMLNTVGHLYTHGHEVDFAEINPPTPIITDLPNYPWDHRVVHWGESRISKAWRTRKHAHHEVLGSTEVASGNFPSVWRNMLKLEDASWLKDHAVGSDVVFPCAGYITMMGEAIRQITGSQSYVLRNMAMKAALLLRDSVQVEILTTMSPVALTERTNSPWYKLAIASLINDTWVENCIAEGKAGKTESKASNHDLTSPLPRTVPSDYLYDRFRRLRLDFGPRFRLLQDISAHTEEFLARAVIKEPGGESETEYIAHPTTIDALLQLSIVAASRGVSRHLGKARVPARIGRVCVNPVSSENLPLPLAAEAVIKQTEGYKAVSMDGMAVEPGEEGEIALEMQDVEFAVLDLGDDHQSCAHLDRMALGRCEWRPHLDFCSIEKLLKPAGQPYRASKAKLEQLTALCILECLHVIEKVNLSAQALAHMVKYVSWLRGQRDRMARGEWLLVPDAAEWVSLDSTSRQALMSRYHENSGLLNDESATKVVELQLSVTQPDSLQALITGEMHPLQLFKEDDRLNAWYDFTVKCMDSQPLITATAHAHPNLRILEIGAGTGGTSEVILRNLLSSNGTRMYAEYMFTDISAGFLATAQERLAKWEGVEYKVLDIGKSPADQGFEAGQYDLVLATNVIHATPCLEETLRNVRFLLRPGGRFLLQELLSPPPTVFVPFVAGFFSGWWDGEDDDRSDQPIVSVERWNRELLAAGFGGIEAAVPDDEDPAYQLMMQITAVVPDVGPVTEPPQTVTIMYDGKPEPFAETLAATLESDGSVVSWCDINDSARLRSISHDTIAAFDLERPFFEEVTEKAFESLIGWISSIKNSGVLWLTRAAQISSTNPAYAQIIGFARTIRVEALVDLWTVEMQSVDAGKMAPVVALAKRFLTRRPDAGRTVDCEFAIHDGAVLVGRYDWSPKKQLATAVSRQEERKSMRIGQRGLLNTIHWVKDTAPAPSDDEVQLSVRYSGLNFKDVMISMGLIPGDHGLCGCEAAGLVTSVGSNVHNVKPGDRVLTLGKGLLSTKLNIPAATVCPIPAALSLEAAATLPAVYCTAIHAIMDKAKLEQGQSVLIHAASGGVGQAALQLCRMLDAEIYATVGSEEKADYLVEEYGLDRKHIFHSRDDSFYEDVMRVTKGRGVDMVLNSLSGELLHASWRCVARFGIMVEIGKRDMLEHGRLPMDMFSGNRTFCGIDLDSMQDRPKLLESLMQRLLQFYADGHIKAVSPIRTFPAEDIQDALRHMQTGKHMGKIVIQMPEVTDDLPAVPAPAPLVELSSSASYLLTGGMGGLGKVIATWMVERGAKNLVFLSRSAGLKPSDTAFVRELESQGCSVTTIAGSVMVLEDVHRAVEAAPSPVSGIIHLSNVLRDKPVRDVRYEDWSTVQGPKVKGTWNLHEALKGHNLDFFILCGSLSAIFGQPGQASYSAANAFLDSFTQFRHNMGLPCSTIDFGAVEGVGGVKDSNLEQYFRNASLHLMQEHELIDALQMAIQSPSPPPAHDHPQPEQPLSFRNPGQFTVGMASTRPLHDPQSRHPLGLDIRMGFARQLEQTNNVDTKSENDSLKQFLASVESQPELLNGPGAMELLTTEIGRLLCTFVMKSEADIDPQTSLESLGVDSLVSIEIRNWWKRTIGTEISVLEITTAQTIEQLGALAVASLKGKFGLARDNHTDQHTQPEVSATELVAKFAAYMDTLGEGVEFAKTIPSAAWPKNGTVLVTGGTGYLGTEILKQLLERDDVSTVLVLVRAASVDAGMNRVKGRAQSAGWWKPAHQARVEIWLGDLSAPKVGLCEEHVSRLRGESLTHPNVDAIIHNGAMVKLDASFTLLEAANVAGTVELLTLALSSKKPLRLVYVSGGLRTDIEQPFEEFADELSTHLAYSRTKNLSDRIILAVAAKLPTHQRRVSVVKPGLLLGSVSTGYTKREDFLSQFIGVVGATRSCPRLCSDRWLWVSTVGKPATTIVKQLHAEDDFKIFEATADGMFMSSLTDILVEEFGLTAQRPSWDEWTTQVTERVADPIMRHAVSAIEEFKRYEDRLPLERQLPESMDAELRESLRSSVRYLAGQFERTRAK